MATISIGVSKACDSFHHKRLISNLEAWGFDNVSLELLNGHFILETREQRLARYTAVGLRSIEEFRMTQYWVVRGFVTTGQNILYTSATFTVFIKCSLQNMSLKNPDF